MGKNRQRYSKSTVDNSRSAKSAKSKVEAAPASGGNTRSKIVWKWLYAERQGLLWVLSCAILGSLLGFGIGTGHLTGSASRPVSAWRVALGSRIRATEAYKFVTMRLLPPSFSLGNNNPQAGQQQQNLLDNDLRRESYHTRVFAVLRESIVREHGGYVHPDLGFLIPAPCGAARGVGMVRSGYHECQTRCIPGISTEKLDHKTNPNPIHSHVTSDPIYRQEEVLIHLPLSYQMTRYVAIQTLSSIIPTEILHKTPLDDLDDAALLTLLLAHERGLTLASRWLPYISSLPKEPSCGYSVKLRSRYLDSIAAMSDELDLEVQGWPTELIKASRYADRIVQALARDYGSYLKTPAGVTVQGNLQWALCQVASRATAGSEKHGSLRLLPLLDQLNHDSTGGGLVELTGTERLEDGDFIDATEQESGAFVVRALRHGRRRALKVGQELVINYNVPQFTPLDWFISVGFVPPERWKPWVKIDPVLPRVRRDGPFDVEEELKSKIWDNSLN